MIETKKPEKILTPEAREIISKYTERKVSLKRMIDWIIRYKLGQKIGGRWYIDREKLIRFLENGEEK